MSLFKKSIYHPEEFSKETGATQIVDQIASIENSINLILTSAKGELFGDPNYGCNLYAYLFQASGEAMYQAIREDIAESLNQQETRIQVSADSIGIEEDLDSRKIYITIPYALRYSNYTTSYAYVIDTSKEDMKSW